MPETSPNWKRAFAQSTYITTIWNWFMVLAGRAAEPVLVASVLYASVKLLPSVHFPPQLDVAVFVAQFVALDIGGLSLNKLADQARKDGNDEGAKQAKDLSVALVVIMLLGVVMAGVDQVVQLNGQVATVIDTLLLIARAVLAVLYSRVIHNLRHNDFGLPVTYSKERIETLVAETVNRALTETIGMVCQEMVKQVGTVLSQQLDERLSELDMRQADAITPIDETVLQKRVAPPSPKVRSIAEAAARKQAASTGPQKIDQVVWPLLSTGMSVREIAAKANTSPATVGRSRKRWEATQSVSITSLETPEQVETAKRVI